MPPREGVGVLGKGWSAFISVATSVVILDVLSKALVVRELGPGNSRQSIEILPGVLAFEYSRNSGVAFGMLSGGSWFVWVAVLMGCLVGSYVVATAMRDASTPMIVALGLCTGGAIGNLIDRILRGHVVDFIEIGSWPSFNIADTALTCGLLIVVACQLLGGKRSNAATR